MLTYSTKPPLDTTVFSIRDATSTIQVQSVKFECISLVEVASPPKNDKFRLSTNYLQKNKMSQTQINDLPGEVLVQIFQLLSPKDLKSAMLVCKSWVIICRRGDLQFLDLGGLGDFEKHGRFAEIGHEEIQV